MTTPLLHRIARQNHSPIPFVLDGTPREGRDGDTVLTAILSLAGRLRHSVFSGAPRAGFCQMGACQDCFVTLESGERLRACSTRLTAGLRVITDPRRPACASR
jgi:predicted molibdopterin-dependent oxidoreductase YjgC